MELLGSSIAVNLRGPRGTYMVAHDDKETVLESPDASSSKARWLIERVIGRPNLIRLKSSSGQYLAGSDRKMDWEPIKVGGLVKLKSLDDKLMQANMEPDPNPISNNEPSIGPTQNSLFATLMRLVGEFLQGTCEPPRPDSNGVFFDVEPSFTSVSLDWVQENSPICLGANDPAPQRRSNDAGQDNEEIPWW